MTANKVIDLIEETLASLPERMSGNDANEIIAQKLRPILVMDRSALLDALRELLAFRVSADKRVDGDAILESRIWLALDIAEEHNLNELRPDIESLVHDVRNGKVLLPVHEKSVARYLQRLNA